MTFDFDSTLNQMLGAAERSFGKDWPKAQSLMKRALQDRKLALKRLANARLRKAIDDAGVQRRLHRSELVMEAAFRATSAISKAAAQKAVNAALKVLENALKQALPG